MPSSPTGRACEPFESDLLYRSRRLTQGGPATLFVDLDPAVRWRHDGLELDIACPGTVHLKRRGLVLVPTAFPVRPAAITSPHWQPTLMYRARGVALLWEPGRTPPAEALASVLGRGRAAVLLALV